MKKRDSNVETFIFLLRAGLWETDVLLSQFNDIDFYTIYKFAEEQSVVGLVAAGLEHISDVKVPQDVALAFAGAVLQLEQRNLAMNKFIAMLMSEMYESGFYSLLVKGQGIAQCYEMPLWRASGDIDLFLNVGDYKKTIDWFSLKGQVVYDEEDLYQKHISVRINDWDIELHGTLRGGLEKRIDNVIDSVQSDTFENRHVRIWDNNGTEVVIPAPDNDIIFVFTHILQHFFRGGIGLRQICDWCRLLWTYYSELDIRLLESRIHKMGLMSEWRAFATLVVDELGMPEDAMPFYSNAVRWKRKSNRILRYILKVGNFGQNRNMSYKKRYPYFIRFMISFYRRTDDFMNLIQVFPVDAMKSYFHLWGKGLRAIGSQIRKRGVML